MKTMMISEDLHAELKAKAKTEGRKLVAMVEHLIQVGLRHEESFRRRKVGSPLPQGGAR
jgi:hypothetical protein